MMEPKPHFLIRGLSPSLRAALEADSTEQPIQETVRSILCEHYDLDCSPISGNVREDARRRSLTILVKMQPELFSALKQDAEETGESMQKLVHEALESRYVTAGR
jgi:predicted HicB family RNase H-like nuclease